MWPSASRAILWWRLGASGDMPLGSIVVMLIPEGCHRMLSISNSALGLLPLPNTGQATRPQKAQLQDSKRLMGSDATLVPFIAAECQPLRDIFAAPTIPGAMRRAAIGRVGWSISLPRHGTIADSGCTPL